ncbi:MAG: ATP-binding cassette domain-containing protein [Verrucomicrobiales bacterium]
MILLLERLSLRRPGFTLEIDAGFTAPVTGLWGPSGAGKTSLLEIIAGLRPDVIGRLSLDGETFSDSARRQHMPPHRRRVGYVPQDLALFPHRTVESNLRYGQKPGASAPALSFDHVVDVLDIRPHLGRGVRHLSGGETQRVALGRALLAAPRLLLLDEPLASLDRALKTRIIHILRCVREEFRVPMILVSHDMGEVAALCDEVLCLESGRIVDVDRQPLNREPLNRELRQHEP